MTSPSPRFVRGTRIIGLAVVALLCSSCLYLPSFSQLQKGSPGAVPWWCASNGSGAALTTAQCNTFSTQIDLATFEAQKLPTEASAQAALALYYGYFDGMGSMYQLKDANTAVFDPAKPQMVVYSGPVAGKRLAGVVWRIDTGGAAPSGFPGSRDVWIEDEFSPGNWLLPMWIIRGYENQPNVFASTHPCLVSGVNLTSTTDACYLASHTKTMQVLVTNDDGITAPGIDAVVESLRDVPGIAITVVAPATNQSGKGDSRTPGGAPGSPATTASGFAGTAVAGTPADSVVYALNVRKDTPDLVVSGTNYGANMGFAVPLSGTIGAARTAARAGIPAMAVSTGFGPTIETTDFQSSADAALVWVEEFRLGLVGPPGTEVANINTPTCTSGSNRGLVNTVVAADLAGRNYNASDCTSTVTVINDDIDAMNHGFTSRTDVGLSGSGIPG